MSAIRDSGGALRSIVGIKVRDGGGVLRTVQQASLRDTGGVLRVVFNSLSATATPDFVVGTRYSSSPVTITTSSTTASVAGGVSPFTHSWIGPGGTWSAGSPSSATTTFSKTGVGVGGDFTTTFTDTITDATGATTTVTVTAEVTNTY